MPNCPQGTPDKPANLGLDIGQKRRKLEQKDVDIRRRINLMQDCEMPCVSHTVCFSPDGKYFFATGTYKPTVKCYEVSELSMKFERGLDADVVKMIVLSEDSSKFVILEEERYVELHTTYGRYFRLRVPHFGRDMAFCREVSELYIAGCHSDIFRLNLEEGRFLEPLKSDASSLNCCQFNDAHQLLVCGTNDGRVEAYDYRDKRRVSTLDCVLNNGIALQFDAGSSVPDVTCVQFKDALHLGVGLSTGQVLLYDIRSSKPYMMKDHQMGLPIKKLEFVPENELVLSMDSRVLKMWHEENGKPFAAIEPGHDMNDFARFPNSGLLFFANDTTKLFQYFVPSLGAAPKWCSYLESITEELEEVEQPAVYDDYKFVTKTQLEEIGLKHLVGTNALRAYMHGYFMDVRLYERAKTLTQPMAFENYKKRKLQERVEEERDVHLIKKDKVPKLPKVNKELALRLQRELSLEEKKVHKPKRASTATILSDSRFQSLFEDPEFEVDPDSEQFKETAPRLKKMESKKSRSRKLLQNKQEDSDEEKDN
uniref:Nucleolar protein 10 n=1 Tax=Ditylenchus dipsaci TaxID=166011 RepID=A0A915DZY0_9BILA